MDDPTETLLRRASMRPWSVGERIDYPPRAQGGGQIGPHPIVSPRFGAPIACLDERPGAEPERNMADARLIALAVNNYEVLRAALERMIETGYHGHRFVPWSEGARSTPGFAESVARGELHPTCAACSAQNSEPGSRHAHESWQAWIAAQAVLATSGEHEPGCDLACASRPGSEQCFA